jgi:hypothetical protein
MTYGGWAAVLVGVLAAGVFGQDVAPETQGVAKIRKDAEGLRALAESAAAQRFLDAAALLPAVEARTLWVDPATREWFDDADKEALPEDRKAGLKERPVDEGFYYNTRYGTPLAYVRVLDLVVQSEAGAGLRDLAGKRMLDFGYGTVGHLRLLGAQGCEAVGVDVDPMLAALYGHAGDAGEVPVLDPGGKGRVTLVNGRWPAEEKTNAEVGGGFDLIVSKNTLKNGYLHPAQEVDKRMLVDLGVPDEEFCRAAFAALKPGGILMIYNLCPAPSKEGEAYKPWADGRCPFTREMLTGAGFVVVAFDADDNATARAMGRALGWADEGMDLSNDLFAWYTMAQRPGG